MLDTIIGDMKKLIFEFCELSSLVNLCLTSKDTNKFICDNKIKQKRHIKNMISAGKTLSDILNVSCENGHIEIVSFLLKEKILEPRIANNSAFQTACRNGQLEIVKFLVQFRKINPASGGNQAIISACEKGHLEVVRFLLKDKRVDPSDKDNLAIGYACENGHIEMVKLLLEDKRVDPSANEINFNLEN